MRKRRAPLVPRTGLLTAVRKTTVEEGRKILKIGVGRDHGVLKAGKKERSYEFSILFNLSSIQTGHGCYEIFIGVYDLACLHMAHLTILAVQFVK
ncbi:hypothetical protein CK203_032157 [Vitis vinifera]|uniref:Uncharacterized protein n=1 Tax=Vitis vinifera TaxID=29760 RepID=A0A438IPG1_VITVI|nr:hypothetical protein CK203_032157 [Vitis vinifera]